LLRARSRGPSGSTSREGDVADVARRHGAAAASVIELSRTVPFARIEKVKSLGRRSRLLGYHLHAKRRVTHQDADILCSSESAGGGLMRSPAQQHLTLSPLLAHKHPDPFLRDPCARL
jgi:hypothetical protein